MLRLFRAFSLTDVVVEVWPVVWFDLATFWATSFSLPKLEARLVTSGVASAEELGRLRADLAAAQGTGAFFAHGDVVVVASFKRRQ